MNRKLDKIEHIVVVMLENRSFDHMLGWLYADEGNVSALGHHFDGLTGSESNPLTGGADVNVRRLEVGEQNLYYMPGADPGEGFEATNAQLFGSRTPEETSHPTNQGFVNDFNYTLGWEKPEGWSILADTTQSNIMACHTPETLPVLSALARQYAVCDRWFASVPTETLPNRAFMHMATSLGRLNDDNKKYDAPSIYNRLEEKSLPWAVYGYDSMPLSRSSVVQITHLPNSHFGAYKDFQRAIDEDRLPAYVFLEPSWGSAGNSQHPNYDVALGEAFLKRIYDSLFHSASWPRTLLVITYDEHGGCYDHVAPPAGAQPPGPTTSSKGVKSSGLSQDPLFGFDRFGVRAPTVLVSPWIHAGSVHRAPTGAMPFDHTSILKTVEEKFDLAPLTERGRSAYSLADVLTLDKARSDDVLQDVEPPPSVKPIKPDASTAHEAPSHLQLVHAKTLAPDSGPPAFENGAECEKYIRSRSHELYGS